MALSNTLFAGLSGLDVNQAKLNVVGNNIANSNTVAFKGTRVMFKPQFYVTDAGGSQPEGTFGGTNPSQRGLGVVVASLERDFSPGSIETTGRSTDMAIDGDGFFVVRGDEMKYTRDGSFKLSMDHQLVTNAGEFVQGYTVDKDFNIIPGQIGNITIPLGELTTAQATGSASIEGNLNANGAVASGASILGTQYLTVVGGGAAPVGTTLLTNIANSSNNATPLFSVGDTLTLNAKKGGRNMPEETLTITAATDLDDLMAFLQNGCGINMGVPDDGNPATPTAGATLEVSGSDPNAVRLVLTGNLGSGNAISLASGALVNQSSSSPFSFVETTDAAGITSSATGESIHTSFLAYDSLGTPLTIDITAVLEGTSSTGTVWRYYVEGPSTSGQAIGTGRLSFDTLGKLQSVTANTVSIDRAGTGAVTPMRVTLEFDSMTALTSRESEMAMSSQDGSAIGRLSGFTIGADGRITGTFTNGVTRNLGQLAIATFANKQGLIDRGGNMFVEGANSGTAIIGPPGTMGTGKIVGGALELSNVDLSEEFINLIIASTGFSASSRVISTSDQLLTELLNTSR